MNYQWEGWGTSATTHRGPRGPASCSHEAEELHRMLMKEQFPLIYGEPNQHDMPYIIIYRFYQVLSLCGTLILSPRWGCFFSPMDCLLPCAGWLTLDASQRWRTGAGMQLRGMGVHMTIFAMSTCYLGAMGSG